MSESPKKHRKSQKKHNSISKKLQLKRDLAFIKWLRGGRYYPANAKPRGKPFSTTYQPRWRKKREDD